jgi:hypothetical protein
MSVSTFTQAGLDLRATHDRLQRLERNEWYRWGVALFIPLILTIALWVLSLSAGANDSADQAQLEIKVRSLLGMVLLFDVFIIYQQVVITRLRRQLTSQLGLIAALDLIKRPEGEPKARRNREEEAPQERRRLVRAQFDQQVKVKTVTEGGRETITQGRIRDMTENGIGAVIPVSLQTGDVVGVEFLADGCPLSLKARVVFRRGFRYGMEFTGLAEGDEELLRRLRLQQLALLPPMQ